jgi:hypothetical protein
MPLLTVIVPGQLLLGTLLWLLLDRYEGRRAGPAAP